MPILLVILLVLVALASLVFGLVIRGQKKQGANIILSEKKFFWLAAILGIIVLAQSCVAIVPTGYTGVKTVFGQISDQAASPGFNLKIPFVETVELVNNKQQTIEISGQIWGESSDKVPVYGDGISVTYQIAPEKSAWLYANVTGGTDNLISVKDVSSALKNGMVSLDSTQVTIRSCVEPAAQAALNEALATKYGEGAVTVLRVVVQQMDFEDSYNEAISKRSNAVIQQEEQAVANETAIAKAEADKQVAITNAEAERQQTIIAAEAQAEARRIQVEAEAEANNKINETVTDTVLKNKFYNVWNGQLPTVMSDGTVITTITP